ncbi:MAG: 3-hydroxyacyl-CoA dehydrogenase family protein [Erythrobacter sp.]
MMSGGSPVIAVVGGGLMGAGIAQIFATAGHNVTVFEPNEEVRATLHERTWANLEIVGADCGAVEKITVVADLAEAVDGATYVTEAAPEKLPLKKSIFADLIALAPHDCILASNTSVIPITHIAEGLDTADRIVGTHWWNPPFLIPLVEVVQAEHTSDQTMQAAMALLESIGKAPAYVRKDTPGFVANRLQHALWREAIAMVAEGVCDPETIDACVKNSFGLRLPVLGPLENADMVGLDLTLDIHHTMMPELDRHDRPNELLEKLVDNGRLGFKSGEGFRRWTQEEMLELRESLLRHLTAANAA